MTRAPDPLAGIGQEPSEPDLRAQRLTDALREQTRRVMESIGERKNTAFGKSDPSPSTGRDLTELLFQQDVNNPASPTDMLKLFRRRSDLVGLIGKTSAGYSAGEAETGKVLAAVSPTPTVPAVPDRFKEGEAGGDKNNEMYGRYLAALHTLAQDNQLSPEDKLEGLARREEMNERNKAKGESEPKKGGDDSSDATITKHPDDEKPAPLPNTAETDFGKLAAKAMARASDEAKTILDEGIKQLQPLADQEQKITPGRLPIPERGIASNKILRLGLGLGTETETKARVRTAVEARVRIRVRAKATEAGARVRAAVEARVRVRPRLTARALAAETTQKRRRSPLWLSATISIHFSQ